MSPTTTQRCSSTSSHLMAPLVGLQRRRNKAHLLELSKETDQHFFCAHELMESALAAFGRVRHHIIANIEDDICKGPCDCLLEFVWQQIVFANDLLPHRLLVRHQLRK